MPRSPLRPFRESGAPRPGDYKPIRRARARPPVDTAPGFQPPPPEVTRPAWMTPDQMLAQARQLASTQQAPSYQSIRDQQNYAARVMDARMAQTHAVYGALGGMLGGIGPSIKGTFNAAANSQDAFGAGFAHGMQLLTQGSADQTNAFLKDVVGAPEGQQIPASQASDAMDVLQFLGGENVAEQFRGQGAGYAQAAERFPMEASAQEHLAELGAQADYQAQSDSFARQIEELARENPLVIAQFLDEIYGRQERAQGAYQDQLDRQAGLDYRTRQDEEQRRDRAATQGRLNSSFAYRVAQDMATRLTSSSDHLYVPRQAKDGSWGIVDLGPKATQPTKPSNLGPYYLDKNGNRVLKPTYHLEGNVPVPNGWHLNAAGKPVKDVTSTTKKVPPGVSIPLSKEAGQWVDSKGNPVSPRVAATLGPPPKPTPKKPRWTGSAPRRIAPGRWQTANGVPLSPAANAYWEEKFLNGTTDGRGKITPAKATQPASPIPVPKK
jgi:hypothetical protein